MIKWLKQFICFHYYKSVNLYYTELSYGSLYSIYLVKQSKCEKCNKVHEKIIMSYIDITYQERCKIEKLLENHGAVNYLDVISKEIKRKD